jgi:hypothetical protein
VAKGLQRLGGLYDPDSQPLKFYDLHSLSRAARLSGTTKLASVGRTLDWRREGVRRLLAAQEANGRWRSEWPVDGPPVIATSFAVLFLASK